MPPRPSPQRVSPSSHGKAKRWKSTGGVPTRRYATKAAQGRSSLSHELPAGLNGLDIEYQLARLPASESARRRTHLDGLKAQWVALFRRSPRYARYRRVDPTTGGMRPLMGPFGTSVFALSLFAGAFNVEIFRSGIEAVPATLDEAAESLGYSRRKRYLAITLPLAFRIAMPALNNNLINLIKTTAEASAIATPELLYYAGQIYSDNFRTLEVMMFIWAVYITMGYM